MPSFLLLKEESSKEKILSETETLEEGLNGVN